MNRKLLIVIFVFGALIVISHPGYGQQKNTTLAADNFLSVFDELQGWDPFFEIEIMQKKMHRMFEDGFSKGLKKERAFLRKISFFEPNLNVKDTDGAYILSADLPGMEKDKINIQIKGRYLTISGERKANESSQDKGFYMQEVSYGNFSRTITLPEDILIKEITSEYLNGVLVIILPKMQKEKVVESSVIKVPVR